MSSIYLYLKALCAVEVVEKPHPMWYITPQFQKFDEKQGSILFTSLTLMDFKPTMQNMHERVFQVFNRLGLH